MSIRSTLEDRPWYRLTAHFFLGLFDVGVLSDSGGDAFRRVVIGIVAVMLTSGLFLVRMYMGKYTALSEIFTRRGPYRLAVLGDDALVIALPMLVVAFATLLVSHSLFPDETDFRVLLALPISRRVVFFSKLLALVLFAGLFIIAAHTAMTPLVVTMSISRWSDQGLVRRLVAYEVTSVGASLFAVLALTAINGLLLMCVPRARLQAASLAFRSTMFCALVLSLPLAVRLPTIGPLAASGSPLLYLAPPVWFLGAERLLLGSTTPYFVRLAQVATAAFVAATAVAVGSYTFLYQRFDRVILRPADAPDGPRRRRPRFLRRLEERRPAFAAISHFTRATLARSPLHQGVFVAVAACGAGLVLNRFIGAAGRHVLRSSNDALTGAVMWAPFALVFAMNLASRAALVLPIEPRANWVFRMTEGDDTRGEQLSAVVHTVVWLGVVVPLLVLFPVEWAVLGPRAIHCTSIAFVCGLLLVELHMGAWRCIPFTCSYAPGKRFVGHTIIIGFAAFVAFTTIGYGLVTYSFGHPAGWLVVTGLLGAVVMQRRLWRLWRWRQTTLIFEEILPNEVEPLQLSSD
jgi:hypothetical protein